MALCSLHSERSTCPTGFIGVDRHAKGWGTRGVVDGARRCDVRGQRHGQRPGGHRHRWFHFQDACLAASHLSRTRVRVVSVYDTDFEVRVVPVIAKT